MRDRWKDCSDEELIIRLREGDNSFFMIRIYDLQFKFVG